MSLVPLSHNIRNRVAELKFKRFVETEYILQSGHACNGRDTQWSSYYSEDYNELICINNLSFEIINKKNKFVYNTLT